MSKNAAPEDMGNGTYGNKKTLADAERLLIDSLFDALENRRYSDAIELVEIANKADWN